MSDDAAPHSSGWRAQLCACAAAFTFLTRVPAWRLVAHDPSHLPAAATYFPLVGLAVGLAGAVAFAAALALWPAPLAIVVSVAFTVWLTGAFHEDALADALDGFGGGWDREQVLAIMKDSRVGSYALVGVVLAIAAKLAALFAIFNAASVHGALTRDGALAVARALVAAHVLGRWSSVFLIARHPYVRADAAEQKPAAGRPFVGAVTRERLLLGSGLALLFAGAALGRSVVLVGAVALLIAWIAGRYFVRRIGGITGDALGAANQLVELGVYLTLAARR
jgi:adenosylcobinamide-GDP ribazoletransferase